MAEAALPACCILGAHVARNGRFLGERGKCGESLTRQARIAACSAWSTILSGTAAHHMTRQLVPSLFPPLSVVVMAAVLAMSSKTSRQSCESD